MNMKFSAPCIFGLEGLCANELRYLGVENVNAENGRVTFTGDWSTLALANINSRYAERILILLAEFEVHTFDNLFEGVKAIPWEDYIGISEAFPVKGRCLDSDLMSVPDCQKIVKKAVADRLSQNICSRGLMKQVLRIKFSFSFFATRSVLCLILRAQDFTSVDIVPIQMMLL